MEKLFKMWYHLTGIAPACTAVILVALVYLFVSWDRPDVNLGEFLRMPIIEMELIQLALVIAAVNILTNVCIRRGPDIDKDKAE